jgi:hypothetical protein
MFRNHIFTAIGLACLMGVSTHAATIIGPSPYLSLSDKPDDFSRAGSIVRVQDFENTEGPWEVGFSIDAGSRIGPMHVSGDGVPVTDSVDADDNAIDGDGTMGSSWFTDGRSLNIRFDEPTRGGGFVFSDTDSRATKLTIQAFARDGSLLISREYNTSFMDDVFTGTTQEDRFFGILAISDELVKRVSIVIDRGSGIEIDHVQFLKPVPEPSSITLMLTSILGIVGHRRRRR